MTKKNIGEGESLITNMKIVWRLERIMAANFLIFGVNGLVNLSAYLRMKSVPVSELLPASPGGKIDPKNEILVQESDKIIRDIVMFTFVNS